MNQRGKGDGKQRQANGAQPKVGDAIMENQQGKTEAGEEEDGEDALADGKEEVIGNKCACVAAEVLDGRIGVDLMARPVIRVETGHRDQQKAPGTEGEKDNDPAN